MTKEEVDFQLVPLASIDAMPLSASFKLFKTTPSRFCAAQPKTSLCTFGIACFRKLS
jgi:hypothetical protein